jgi:phosphate transport system permease protein
MVRDGWRPLAKTGDYRSRLHWLSRQARDRLAGWSTGVVALAASLLVVWIGLALLVRAWPILTAKPLGELLFSSTWKPLQGAFGYWPFIMGTLWVTLVAMAIAVPICLLSAIYLVEYAKRPTRALMKPLLDLLAGIPSVVYGVWGVVAIVPWVQSFLSPFLSRWLGFIPLFTSTNPTGFSVLAGSIVLAVMVVPVIVAVSYEVMQAVPDGLREASLAIGATKWQTVKHAVLPQALPGIIAAVVLGFSRAFGETMAVLMVVGNVPRVPSSIFDPAYPLTALIANNYGEMLSIPLYDAALLAAALVLLLVVLAFNILSALILRRVTRRYA